MSFKVLIFVTLHQPAIAGFLGVKMYNLKLEIKMKSAIRLHNDKMVCCNTDYFEEFINDTDEFELGIGIAIEGREVIFGVGDSFYNVLLSNIKQGLADYKRGATCTNN